MLSVENVKKKFFVILALNFPLFGIGTQEWLRVTRTFRSLSPLESYLYKYLIGISTVLSSFNFERDYMITLS